MLPLAGPDFPTSLADFSASLRGGFTERGIVAREVRVEGEWPRIAEISVDLTGARLSRSIDFPRGNSEAQPALSIARLAVSAAPLHFEETPIRLEVHAEDADCAFTRDSADQPLLQLTRAASGSVVLEAQRSDLESKLKEFATTALAKQGADVKSVRLDLNDLGPRSLGFRADVTAKAFLMTARVFVTGRIDVDDQMNLRVRDLATGGDGMIANLAGSFLRPRFAEIEKRVIPLPAFSFAGLKPQNIRISGGEALRIEAKFCA